MSEFRVGQQVCRVAWADGVPCLRFAKVTKVTIRNCYVDGEKKASYNWHGTAKEAIDFEYRDLFSDWGLQILRPRPHNWTVRDTVRCVCRLRRMEIRLIRRRKK